MVTNSKQRLQKIEQSYQEVRTNSDASEQTSSDSVEFSLLLQLGLDFCQKWGVQFWTDFNEHDPGVTILEQLCYAITDLNYRANFSVADILAEQPQESLPGRTSFFTGNLVLTGTSLTIDDYRKYLYDAITADGRSNFKNVWLLPAAHGGIEGLYDIFIETFDPTPGQNTELCQRIKTLYQESRNLTEDVESVTVMQQFPILVAAVVDIDIHAEPDQVLAQILFEIQNFLVPFVNILSPDKLLQDGIPPEQIYEGPLLRRGVIASDQFTALPTSVTVTAINNIILAVNGVVSVSNLTVNGLSSGTITIPPATSGQAQIPSVPRLAPSLFHYQGSYPIQIARHGKTLLVDTTQVSALIAAQLSQFELNQTHAVHTASDSDYTQLPQGTSRDIAAYFSIQRQFPKTYGIGEDGPQLLHSVGTESAQSNTTRLAKAKQLKAYLLFFEQLLSNSLAQLANAARLFSLDETLDRSYFWQSLVDAEIGPPDIVQQQLLVSAPEATAQSYRYSTQVSTPGKELLLRSPWFNTEAEVNANRTTMLMLGCQPSAYQIQELPNRELLICLTDHKHTKLGFGTQRYGTSAEAELAIARLVELMCEMTHHPVLQSVCIMTIQKQITLPALTSALTSAGYQDDAATIAFYLKNLNALVQRYDPFLHRRNRFLNNLLARFDQSFDDALLEAADPRPGYMKDRFRHDLIQWKNAYLKRYAPATISATTSSLALGGARGKGLNSAYANSQVAGSSSGLEQRLKYLLGLGGVPGSDENQVGNHCDYHYSEETNQANANSGKHHHMPVFTGSGLPRFLFQSPHPTILRSLLVHGKDVCNYSIAPHGEQHHVMFRWPDELQAQVVHIAESEAAAQTAIQIMACYFLEYAASNKNYYLDESVVVVDHILLRPTGGRASAQLKPTPTATDAFYSFRISLMFPDWPIRFQDAAFRELAHSTTVENCPAHVQANSYWLNAVKMSEFRALYADWLALQSIQTQLQMNMASQSLLNAASARLVNFILQLDATAIDSVDTNNG
ncbi:hypothetical protein ACO0LB_17155 [Undibacterium sp. SXout7W]|uniref:hypothetical protein n=1 Tax=Undibacterium sp. SXout7W TaxID=3413049 RepID=UPI003BF45B63